MKKSEIYMPSEHQRVWQALQHCRGFDQAVSHADMAEALGLGVRRYRKIVQELKGQFAKPIGSRFGQGGGHYLIVTEEERRSTIAALWAHAVSCIRGIKALDNAAAKKLSKQLELELK